MPDTNILPLSSMHFLIFWLIDDISDTFFNCSVSKKTALTSSKRKYFDDSTKNLRAKTA